MNAVYAHYQNKLKKQKIKTRGFTNITIAGFKNGEPFIYAMDSKDKFHPALCRNGSIYSCIEENMTDIDEHIKRITSSLGLLQEDSIDRQKDFIRRELKKIFMLLGAKYEQISQEFDLVFITQDGSILEATEEKGDKNDGSILEATEENGDKNG